jgi:eukaryotic-like serine/threonine-protein kinase
LILVLDRTHPMAYGFVMPEIPSKDSEQVLGYRLIERLGAGGFGEVWKAEAPGGLLKAVKFIYGRLGERQANQEVKALDRIKEVRHPFILSLERVEVVDGRLIMVSELADRTLLDRFEECRADGRQGIPRRELLRYLHDAAEALDFMAAQFRLQHLDIKPSNLFLMGGRLKIGDFGLLREVCHLSASNTGALSPAYAAPESLSGEMSLYADQYQLAIVYQEMLTGVRPFRGRTALQLSEQHLHAPPNVASLAPGEQPVIGRALAKDPKARFPSCGEMVQALASIEVAEPPAEVLVEGSDGEPVASSSVAPFTPIAQSMELAGPLVESAALPTLRTGMSSHRRKESAPVQGIRSTDHSSEGLPEPTLFVGVGGVAGSVLRQIKSLFETRYEDLGEKRRLGWLLLDTDRTSLEEIRRAEVPGHLASDQTVHVPLHGPEHYRPQFKQLLNWLDRHWLFSIPRTHLTEGIRPLGRLALLDNADVVLGGLRRSIRQVRSTIVDEEERRRFQIIVIAGIAGGTGGGCVADVGVAIRRILAEEQIHGLTLSCVLIMATSVRKDRKELARANALVTLSELRQYHDPRCPFPGVEALGVGPKPEGTELFDEIALANFGDIVVDEDLESSSHLLAERIYLERGTLYGRTLRNPKGEADPAGAGVGLRCFRLVRLGFPRAELRRLIAREVCTRMIDRWLHGRPSGLDDHESAGSRPNLMGATDTPEPPVTDADTLFAQMQLDECRFQEVFLERGERACGTDPLKSCLRKTKEMLTSQRWRNAREVVLECFDELDERLGRGSAKATGHPPSLTFAQKLHNEFKHDRSALEQRLEAWVRGIVDRPSQRLKPAAEMLGRFIQQANGQIAATPARIKKIEDRKRQLRARHKALVASLQQRVTDLLRPLYRENEPVSAELAEYGQLCIQEVALGVRAEVLVALLAKASRIGEELGQWHQRLAEAQRLFEAKDPGFQNSKRASLGHSIDLLPVDTVSLAELRLVLASAFSSEPRLAKLDRSFQDEVLGAFGGLSGVLTGEPRFATELFGDTLFHRVCAAVDRWQEEQDAASILHKRYGSMDAVVAELARLWKSALFGFPEYAAQRLLVGTPDSPSGRSLREGLMKSAGFLSNSEFLTIPDDIVLCLEVQDLSFASVLAELIGGQSWLAEVAPKLVSRIDIDWAELAGTERIVKVVGSRE